MVCRSLWCTSLSLLRGSYSCSSALAACCCFSFLQVFDAWLGFALERQRKKGRIEKAVEFYRATLLKEGVTQILKFMAGMKQFRGQLQTQHQLKVKETHIIALSWALQLP